jgi:hypothetical protein
MIEVKTKDQESHLLGRQMVHDSRSRSFPLRTTVDKTTWKDKAVRLYEPWPNPNQPVGCCTGTAKASQFNAVGNRVMGTVLKMDTALDVYRWASRNDPWPGAWEPDDTGSSGLASARAAKALGLGGEYRWLFGGADEVVQAVMDGQVISVGSWWHWDMFNMDSNGVVKVGGGYAGGHQYVIRGYDKSKDLVLCRNWWGPDFRDFWMSRSDLDTLLRDDGDAHFQKRAGV